MGRSHGASVAEERGIGLYDALPSGAGFTAADVGAIICQLFVAAKSFATERLYCSGDYIWYRYTW